MKFCVTPTSQYRSINNTRRFHFEGDTKNPQDIEKMVKIIHQAMQLKVTVKVFNTLES